MRFSFILASIAICLTVDALPLGSIRRENIIEKNTLGPRQTVELKGKFLHVTDIHLDAYYLAKTDPSNLCHRKSSKDSKNVSGKFGALGTDCDSPTSLVQASFDFMKQSLSDVDFVIYTGDTARHDRDDSLKITDKDILEEHTVVTQYFKDTYNIPAIPFIPTIGNNDGFNHNDVVIEDPIFKSLKTIWAPFNLNLTDDFSEGGYFVQDIIPGKLQAMSINTMYFFSKNSEAKNCNTAGTSGALQITWMKKVLDAARTKKTSVYVVGHVPPNDDDASELYKSSCHELYIDLLGSYGDVIAGHFTGHTNSDMLTAIVKDGSSYSSLSAVDDSSELTSSSMVDPNVATVLFNAPSIIPVNNPAIRVYNYETQGTENPFGTILDWIQYYADLEEANDSGELEYKIEYQASELFGIETFDAAGVSKAFTKLATDKTIRKKYISYVSTKAYESMFLDWNYYSNVEISNLETYVAMRSSFCYAIFK
ncbi:secreted endopolyphosphatase [Phycomyces blakesleeanus NRRL 1555(-)]|uniref:Secreted endopolyphosphatase n=1 Tax=Phycomyces blakesleeanus (strain ATCC 8743b / DSM 1359 / FGSC 10004 / NBRC 33097 / NRRL 1555) TaxID=763407 RepID=A0A167QKA8_PHYB8|nr:secreted endopolyphosphatase [Phycomyces blakesleeanus NRRL 1555(-)]OAD79830.1 secreted endopolyphosphatase [Phycomyces blakesleeanus NRRL 1555(-)]|eukprot:XP_018297870.1 secreted endopolyphosphatase [Phycomyces blakesleeanus NRRL 1555(-)]